MDKENKPVAVKRSSFVTWLAWSFIVLAGFSILSSLMQGVGFAVVSSAGGIQEMMNAVSPDSHLPGFVIFIFNHLGAILLFSFLTSIAMLVASVALLRRRNWARLVFVWLLALSIVGNIAVPFFQYWIMSSFMPSSSEMAPDFKAQFEAIRNGMLVVSVVIMLAFSWLSAWLIKRLVSSEIRAEFGK